MTEYAFNPMVAPRKEVTHEQMQETLKRRVREAAEKFQARQVNGSSGVENADTRALSASGGEPNCPGIAEQTTVRSCDPPAAPTLEWNKPVKRKDGTGYIESVCQQFYVSKSFVNGKAVYLVSQKVKGRTLALGTKDTAADAQALAQSFKR